MARIRTIKPEITEDEVLGGCSRDARHTFILLFTVADDFGRFRANTILLKNKLYPYDENLTAAEMRSWLEELTEKGRLRFYEVDGQSYGELVNWSKHQRVDNASTKGACPPPSDGCSELTLASDGGEPPQPDPARGEPPQLAAARAAAPLDHDLDLDLDPDPDDDHDRLAAVSAAYCELALEKANGVSSSKRFLAGVARNFRKEHLADAQNLLSRHPDASVDDIARWVMEGIDPETPDERDARYEAERKAIA